MKNFTKFLFILISLTQALVAQDKQAKQAVVYGDIPDYKEYYLSPDFI